MTAASANRRRWIALCVVCLAMMMNILDQTIVNVALPSIQRGLGFSQANLAWVIDAYLITFAGALLLAGRLGDLIGRKKTFLGGVTLFAVSSLICAVASSQGMLIGARFAQGLGAAFSSSVILAIIVAEFPEPLERAKAMSAYILVSVGGGSAGLLLGGILTQALTWHWIFLINVPIGALTLVAGAFLLDENEGLGLRAGVDIVGAVMSTGGLMLAIYAIVTSTDYGWGSAHTLIFLGVAVVVLAGFMVLETRLKNPMLPVQILRAKGLGATSLARGLMVVGMYGSFFLGALYVQKVHGFNAIGTGAAFLPQTLSVAVMSLGLTALIMKALRPKGAAVVGLGIVAVGLAMFAVAGVHTAYFPLLFFSLLLVGIGSAMAFTPLLTMGLANIPGEHAGLGSGLVSITQQVSAAIAVAILGVVSSDRTKALSHHEPNLQALTGGYQLAFEVGAGCAALGMIVCITLVRSPATAEAAADLGPMMEAVEL